MRRVLAVGLVAFVLAGCGSNSFVGRRTDNFTAYYNTFYNARRTYDEGTRALERGAAGAQAVPVDRTRYLAVYPLANGQSQQAKFENTIKKSADVLRKHPDSKWADDALLLIGQSYFYLGQYVGAEQKFREIITELPVQTGRKSGLDEEARFWLARTLAAGGRRQVAQDFLAENLSREGIGRRTEARLHLVRADLAVQQGDWDAAADALRAGIERADDAERKARARFVLGQVEETRGNYAEAAEAFADAARDDRDFELAYAASVSAARLEGTQNGADRALGRLRDMDRDAKNADRRAELAFLRGRIHQAAGRPDDAFRAYDDALHAGYRDAQTVRGRAQYGLAELYRDSYGDYFVAAAYFDSAATALGSRQRAEGAEERTTREAILDVAQEKEVFAAYATVRREIADADSLLRLGGLDNTAYAEAILGFRRQRARELAAEERQRARANEQQRFSGEATALDADGRRTSPDAESGAVGPGGAPSPSGGAVGPGPGGATTASASGFLSYLDLARVRDNRIAFLERWGDRPLVPNWRRREAITGAGAVALAATTEPQDGALNRVGQADDLPQIDLSAIPRTDDARASLRSRRAEARYRLGNVLFLSMTRPDSAAVWYRLVVEQDADEAVAPRAFYALGEVQRALGDTLAAAAIYRQALERYPALDFAGRIRERLGMEAAAAVAAPTDSLAEARVAYEAAVRAEAAPPDSAAGVQVGAPDDPFVRYITVAAEYPGTPVAAQALLAAGQTLLARTAGDTLAQARAVLPADPALLARAGIAVDTTAYGGSSDSTLRVADLYRALASNYASTPYGERAGVVLTALAARLPVSSLPPANLPSPVPAPPDSTGAAPTDAVPAATPEPDDAPVKRGGVPGAPGQRPADPRAPVPVTRPVGQGSGRSGGQ